ncbi:cytochrome P450 [Punctularia strigosozonata HHB-11173 SS5]|uniref:cytochrome P450 n=1 Tax=Punctularia strigosozonata (strain HHB-11173) TaxID=741275 RepID=UPI00044166BF|nr:cytochrome P450 [Punctularia strigosozonata HHB-11173 SS5]EIN08440.1 cytochrome P450 [Punctularia strigosozonata HHB-11173 SS5]
MVSLVTAGLTVCLIYVLHKLVELRRLANSIGLPRFPLVSLGKHHIWEGKWNDAARFGWDVYSSVALLPPKGQISLYIADADVVQEVTGSRARFPKPVWMYSSLSFFGRNIVASEFEEWKKYRKLSAPSFSERNNKLVWDETVRIMLDLFDNVWQDRNVIAVDHCVDITLPIALFVIGVAGFGRRVSWKDDQVVPPGHRMTFKDALHVVSMNIFTRLIVPNWAMGFTKKTRELGQAFDELELYMDDMIRERRSGAVREERHDLFSSLMDAADDVNGEGGAGTLSDMDLKGNIFIFMLAGHETAAHTLAFTFGLLALYPQEQEVLYQQIMSIIPDGRTPTYEEMNLFTRSMAVFYETLRMFPPAPNMPKYSAEDTTLTFSNSEGERRTVPVPAGTNLLVNAPALHYNPRYWHDPYAFDPSRFLKPDWPREAFVPFSQGARACLGRRFFETEGIAVLTMLVSRYKIELADEPEFSSETFEQRKARLLRTRAGLTMTPIRLPLVFKRR